VASDTGKGGGTLPCVGLVEGTDYRLKARGSIAKGRCVGQVGLT